MNTIWAVHALFCEQTLLKKSWMQWSWLWQSYAVNNQKSLLSHKNDATGQDCCSYSPEHTACGQRHHQIWRWQHCYTLVQALSSAIGRWRLWTRSRYWCSSAAAIVHEARVRRWRVRRWRWWHGVHWWSHVHHSRSNSARNQGLLVARDLITRHLVICWVIIARRVAGERLVTSVLHHSHFHISPAAATTAVAHAQAAAEEKYRAQDASRKQDVNRNLTIVRAIFNAAIRNMSRWRHSWQG